MDLKSKSQATKRQEVTEEGPEAKRPAAAFTYFHILETQPYRAR